MQPPSLRDIEAARPRALPETIDEPVDLLRDLVEPDLVQQRQPRGRRIRVGHGRRSALEPPRGRRPVEPLGTEREGIDTAEPAGGQRFETRDEIVANVQERDA